MSDGTQREAGPEGAADLSRRRFLRGAGGAAAGGVLAPGLLAAGCTSERTSSALAPLPPATTPAPGAASLAGEFEIALAINGVSRALRVEARTTLLDALRTRLDPALTGTKSVCDRGNCGACTVLVDGEPRYACLQLACDLGGRAITTIEGLGAPDALSPLQAEFVRHDGSMCGFCTPGFVVAISACLQRNPGAGEAEIRESCAGNACRCGTQPQVFAAALAASRGATEAR